MPAGADLAEHRIAIGGVEARDLGKEGRRVLRLASKNTHGLEPGNTGAKAFCALAARPAAAL